MIYPKQAVTKIVKEILETFGGSKYREFTLDKMKQVTSDIVKKGSDDFKTETGKALSTNTYGKLLYVTLKRCDKLKTVESFLSRITEYYMSLT